ncbi:usg-like family protein [Caedimonas varicaedens]|uniref:Usg-like family protein n=1 Tax=Caedimonas varicaedens TaxID=1629334 RepID=A0A0K8MC29_9PROT|nr:usg-like family protein [Caedimonas varicaedens]
MSDLSLQLHNYRLTTAEIIYHMPDYPQILQSYIWQDYDLLPDFPILHRFIHFWEKNLEGKMHSITIAHVALIKPAEFRMVQSSFSIH